MLLLPRRLLWNHIPDIRVDPQGSGQGQTGSGAGGPATQRAGHCPDDPLQLGHFLQAGGAEGVVAVKDPWDPAPARVLAAAHDALERLAHKHGGAECSPSPHST